MGASRSQVSVMLLDSAAYWIAQRARYPYYLQYICRRLPSTSPDSDHQYWLPKVCQSPACVTAFQLLSSGDALSVTAGEGVTTCAAAWWVLAWAELLMVTAIILTLPSKRRRGRNGLHLYPMVAMVTERCQQGRDWCWWPVQKAWQFHHFVAGVQI